MRPVRFLATALVTTVLAAPSLAQPPVAFADAGIHAIQFIDQAEGWAVGDDGVIWHSINGGKRWERQKSGTRASLRGVHFQTPYTGWAVGRTELTGGGSVGVMLRTTDGGIRWESMGTNVLPGLHAVHFFDEKAGFVCGDSSPAFPSGMFTTADGGRTWKPVSGVSTASCRAVDFFGGQRNGVVAGAWSRLGTFGQDGIYRESDFDPLAGRTLHAVTCGGSVDDKGDAPAFAVGDGGAVLSSTDGGKSWGFVNLGLSPEALASCDFRCCASIGVHIWVAGKPGGFLLHSGDHGKTWEVQKTGLLLPVNGLFFLTHEIGWMVGELGCILGTSDGGKTWSLQQAGGQRTAVLFLHASLSSTPLDVVSLLGHGDGYLCTAVALMSADPATSDPKFASDAARLQQAIRLAGGAAGDVGWAFPVAAHAAGLPPRDLMATWDRSHGGKAAEQLLRQAVLAIRMWQPEVILADSLIATDRPADALALHAAKEAFKQAADPNCFPEQIKTLGLKPWSAKKLYALSGNEKGTAVLFDRSRYIAALADSPGGFAKAATLVLGGDSACTDRRAFTLVSHRLEGAEKHTSLMDGIVLARGGSARRPETPTQIDPTIAEERKRSAQASHRLESIATIGDPEFAGTDRVLGILGSGMRKMPDDIAARTAHAVATRLAREGRWIEAREVFALLSVQHPGHPLAIEAFRWLTRYHASSEARRRTEIQQRLLMSSVAFEALPGKAKVIATSGTVTEAASATVHRDVYRFYSPEAIMKWHQACLDLEPKLLAYGPLYSRDPSAWLCFLAARRQVGRHNEAVAFIRDYFKNTPGAAQMRPGIDLWRDGLAAELWMIDRNLIPIQPKPVGLSKRTEIRPFLDGRLDDACWRDGKAMVLSATSTAAPKQDEIKEFNDAFRSEARFAYDEDFLYVAVSCLNPHGMRVEPVAKRPRDADLSGHDHVEILLDLDRDYQTYYRFQVDHRGCLAEDCWGDRSWNPKYFAAFHTTDEGWTAELAIPIRELTDERVFHGKTWAANVSRIMPGKGALTWSGPAEGTSRPEGMGLLQFRADK